MVRAFAAHVIRDTVPTSTGTKDFTAPGVGGTPLGAVVMIGRTDVVNGHDDDLSLSWGCTDGTTTIMVAGRSLDEGVLSSCSNYSADNGQIGGVLDPADAVGSFDVVADFDSFIANGIRLDFTTVDGFAWRVVVVLFFGTDCECAVWKQTNTLGTGATEDVNVGFEPTFVLTCAPPNNFNEGFSTRGFMLTLGVVDRDTETNHHTTLLSDNNVATTATHTYRRIDAIATSIFPDSPPPVGNSTKITTFTSTGFTISNQVSGSTEVYRMGGIAVRASDRATRHDVNLNAPTTPTQVSIATGWKTGFAFCALSANSVNASAQAQMFGSFGFHDFAADGGDCLFVHDRHNLTTTQTGVRYHDDKLAVNYSATGTNLQKAAEATLNTASGWTLDFTTADANARKYALLSVEEVPFTGTGASTLSPATAAGTGELVFTAAGAATLASVTAAGTGSLAFSAAGAATLGAVAGAAVGELIFSAAGASSLAPVEAAAAAELVFAGLGAPSLAPAEAAGAGALVFTASSEATLDPVTAAASASLVFVAAGSPALAAAIAAGAGTSGPVASGAVILAAVEAAGTGALVFVATGEAELAALIAAGTGQVGAAADGCWVLLGRAIRTRFEAELSGLVALAYPNEGMAAPTATEARIEVGYHVDRHVHETLGAPIFRKSGRFVATIHVPLAEGDGRVLLLADAIVTAFRGVAADGVCYRVPSLTSFERVDRWWTGVVECPFIFTDASGVTA